MKSSAAPGARQLLICDPVCVFPYGHNIAAMENFRRFVGQHFDSALCLGCDRLPGGIAKRSGIEQVFQYYYDDAMPLPDSADDPSILRTHAEKVAAARADLARLLDWCERSGGRIHRYEDMVANPLGFIQAFQEFSGLKLSRAAIDLALIKAAFLQGSADRADHNRHGIPHEALRTLPDAELAALNRRFAPLLDRLGYPLDRSAVPPLDLTMLIQRDAMKRYIHALAEQNGQRIAEIRRLQEELAALRDAVQLLRQSGAT